MGQLPEFLNEQYKLLSADEVKVGEIIDKLKGLNKADNIIEFAEKKRYQNFQYNSVYALRKVLYTNQVEEIKKNFYKITNDYVAEYDEIHLLYAGPAGLAVEIGRCIRKNMWPKVTLYNYRKNNNPSYEKVFSINE
ncbi:SAVED domain-containing protein [Clostridium botulinum]|nr:SAVED domain-containing protein [Clostridium botulinum]